MVTADRWAKIPVATVGGEGHEHRTLRAHRAKVHHLWAHIVFRVRIRQQPMALAVVIKELHLHWPSGVRRRSDAVGTDDYA